MNKNISKKLFKASTLMACAMLASCNGSGTGPETPPEPEFDYSKYPLYQENIDSIGYEFNDEEIRNPFWKGNVIYNESVLLTKDDETGEISGNLLFKPIKILKIWDYTLKTTEYIENVDYTLDNNKIIRTENSSIPYRTKAQLTGEEVPEGFVLKTSITNQLTDLVNMGGQIYTESPFYYGSQIWVSYVYDVKDIDPNIDKYPTYGIDKLPKLKEKLENKESVKIVGLGDSVLEGCSSSKKFNHEPFMPSFIELTATSLGDLYETNVTLKNLSVGGTKSSWGAQNEQIQNIIKEAPDVLFLHFGINDLGENRTTMAYADDMESIILKVRLGLPDVEIVLLSPFAPNPALYDYEKMQEYVDYLGDFASTYDGVTLIDVFNLSKELYKTKKYLDMSANGINHVNDFASRIYLNSIVATLYDFKK